MCNTSTSSLHPRSVDNTLSIVVCNTSTSSLHPRSVDNTLSIVVCNTSANSLYPKSVENTLSITSTIVVICSTNTNSLYPRSEENSLSIVVCNTSANSLHPRAPMGSSSRGGGVSRLSLPTPFSPIFVCPSAYRNLSPVLLFTHQLLPTYLQFSSSDCPFCLHRPFTYISLLYKPSFCHFSFSLWSTRDPARWLCAATRVVGGWDPGDWGHCWAAAPHFQHITSARTSARREVRKARPDQSVGGTSLVGVFHRDQSGVSSPWVYFIHSPGVTSLDIWRENWHPLVGLGGGWGVDKMKWKWT